MSAAQLCVTVTGATMAELRARRDRVADADLVELRLDGVRDPSVEAALAGRRRPVIVTCRPVWEGGRFDGPEEVRRRLLEDALDGGAEFVDVEWRAGFAEAVAAKGGPRVVISMHDFVAVPRDLSSMVAHMAASGAGVVKVAVTATRLAEMLPLKGLAGQAPRAVVLAMGEAGLATRVLAGRFGSAWTYAGDGVAPGQRPAEEYVAMGFRRLGPSTALFGVVGRPVGHSLSPAIHNAGFESAGVDAVYLPLAAADFDDFLVFAAGMGLAGASVTAPFKVEAFERASTVDEAGRAAGAVNTLRRAGSGWDARNTDIEGFLAPLRARGTAAGLRAVVLGAGGAARSAALALKSEGASVALSARRPGEAARVAAELRVAHTGWPPADEWDLIVNATPAGTVRAADDTPLPGYHFAGRTAYDLVYNPAATRFLREAAAAGLQTIDGLEMLVAQAMAQFQWWTGRPAPAREMRAAALAALAREATRAAGSLTNTHAATD